MLRKWALLALLLLIGSFLPGGASIHAGFAGSQISALLPHPLDADKVLVASGDQLFETDSHEETRKNWGRVPESGSAISKLHYFPVIPEILFAVTLRNVFSKDLEDMRWKKIFAPDSRAEILSFTVQESEPLFYYAGTQQGLWHSDNAGKNWRELSFFSGESVCALHSSKQTVWVSTADALFHSKAGGTFTRSFSLPAAEAEEEPLAGDSESVSFSCFVQEIQADGEHVRILKHGNVWESRNGGKTWRRLPHSGISEPLFHLAYGEHSGRLFAASKSEVFEFLSAKKRWQKITGDWESFEVKSLHYQDGQKELWIRTPGRIFRHAFHYSEIPPAQVHIPAPQQKIPALFSNEPDIRELHRAVIRWANAGQGKIKRWHAESRMRALLPDVSFNRDFDWGNNIDIDRRGTNDPDAFIEGPSDISKGWSFGVSWDLGDLIFNSSQTSIDSRDKLTAELRHDLTAEATRLYYERRRAQMEAALYPADAADLKTEQELRIEELTALLDAMTGGWFSEQLSHKAQGARSTEYGVRSMEKKQ